MGVDLFPRPPSHAALAATLRPLSNLGRKTFLRFSRGQLKMQTATATATARLHPVVSRCTAGQSCEPAPDEDESTTDWAKKVRGKIDRFAEEYAAKLGVSIEDSTTNSKDMFCDKERKIMDNFWDIFSSCSNSDILHAEGKIMSLVIYWTAAQALSLSSRVMESASSRLQHPTEISLNTIEQTVRIYTSIFVKVSKDTYNGKVNKGTVISLLGALEGLAAISHILLQDTVDGVNYILLENGLTKYSPSQDVDALHSDYKKEMRGLKQNIIRTASAVEVCKVLDRTLRYAGTCTITFILLMLCFRGKALAQAPGFHSCTDAGLNTRPTDTDGGHPPAPEDN